MSSGYINLPVTGVPNVSSASSLPMSGNAPGNLYITLDTSTLYEWNGTQWLAIATPGAATAIDGLMGDVAASGPGVVVATLATVNANVGSFGTASSVGSYNVNGKGLTTSSVNIPIQIAESQVTNLVADLAGKQATGNYMTGLTGDGVANGPGSSVFNLATVNVSPGTFGDSGTVPQVTVNTKGLVTGINLSSIQIAEFQVTNLTYDLGNKQPTIVPGTTLQYYRGDKTFQTLNTSVVPESGSLYYTNARTIASTLTGFVAGAGTVTSADSVLSALQKISGNAATSVSGTANYIPQFATATTLSNSPIYNSSGNIGIGTIAPVSKLSIIGTATAGNVVIANLNNPYTYGVGAGIAAATLRFTRTAIDAGSTGVMADISGGNEAETTSQGGYLAFATRFGAPETTIERMRISSTGNVGIGGTTPGNRLTVYSPSNDTIPAIGANGGSFAVLNNSGGYGLIAGEISNGNVFFQAQRVDGTATAYNMLLQPNGGNVGIGTTSPSYLLDINGNSRTQGEHYLNTLGFSGAGNHYIKHEGGASSTDIINFRNSSNTDVMTVRMDGNVGIGTTAPGQKLDVVGNAKMFQLVGSSTAPGIAAGTGAGTSPTVALSGTDLAGKITVTTGTLPAGSGTVFTVTFNTAYGSAPYVVFSPGGPNAAGLTGLSSVYVGSSTTTFSFTSGSAGLAASTQYIWNYHVIG